MHAQTPTHVGSEHAAVGVIADGKGGTVADPALAWAEVAGLVEVNGDGSWKVTELGKAGLMRVLEQVVQHPPAEGRARR